MALFLILRVYFQKLHKFTNILDSLKKELDENL